MSLDRYKTMTPEDDGYYSDYVSSCCGAEIQRVCTYDEYMHDGIICDDCGHVCEELEQYEYEEKMREHYADMKMDEDRL